MVNIANCLSLADEIELLPQGSVTYERDIKILSPQNSFNMTLFQDDCGSPCCIAGHAAKNLRLEKNRELLSQGKSYRNISDDAQEYLGLTDTETDILFNPLIASSLITPSIAAQALRLLATLPEWSLDQEEEPYSFWDFALFPEAENLKD